MNIADVLIIVGAVGGIIVLVVLLLLDSRYKRTTIRWMLDVERRRREDHEHDDP